MSRDCSHPLVTTVEGLRRAKGFACLGMPDMLQPAPAPSRSQHSSLSVTDSFCPPKFSLSSVGVEAGGEEQSLSAGAVWPSSGAGPGEQKTEKWDANLRDFPWGSGRMGPC